MAVERSDDDYVEKGGLQWGPDLQFGGVFYNVSYPFGRIRVSPERLHFKARMWPLVNEQFDLAKSDLIAIRPFRGLFTPAVRFEHTNVACPTRLVFWSFSREGLLGRLRESGYPVVEET